MESLQQQFTSRIVPVLKESLKKPNAMAVPKITQVVVNAGISPNKGDKALLDVYEDVFMRITGQKPVRVKAKKSISNFKVREGQINGMRVTLRGPRMWDFIEKLITITLPRVRDFRGIDPKIVDSTGNLSLGFKEHLAFPEINADEVEKICSLQICISTTAANKQEGLALFEALGFPFRKDS